MQRFASHRCLSSLRKFLGLAAVVSLASVFTTPAMGGRHPATLLPLEAARMDEYLSPERMMGELELSTADGQRLLEQLPVREVYSSDGGGARLEQTPIRLSPMTVRTFKKWETPDAPDLTAVMDGDTPRVEVASASGPIRWMGSNDTAISSIQVLGHDLFGASPATTEAFAERWQRAATHPVVVVTTEDEVLFAHNGVTVLSQTRTTTASGHRDIQNQYGFRTVLYSIKLADFTTDSLDGYRVVLDTEEIRRVPFPVLWVLPVSDGALDNSRFGFKIVVSTELADTRASVGGRTQVYEPMGRITRVRIEGGTPEMPSVADGRGPNGGANDLVPGADDDPLLRRAAGEQDPTPWGWTAALGGAVSSTLTDYVEVGPAFPVSATGWYKRAQVELDVQSGRVLGAALFRGGAARDVNYVAGGLVAGNVGGRSTVGGRLNIVTYRSFGRRLMAGTFDVDLLLGDYYGAYVSQDLSARISLGNGRFILPGVFYEVGFGSVQGGDMFETASSGGTHTHAMAGGRVKFVFNGNAP